MSYFLEEKAGKEDKKCWVSSVLKQVKKMNLYKENS